MKVNLLVVLVFLTGHHCLKAQSLYPGQFEDKISVSLKAPVSVYSFELSDVRLLEGPFRENMERASEWIMSLDADRLLHSFRTTAGMYSGREGGYFTVKKLGGWESLDCELRGHTTGHILSALALLYGATGDEKYKLKADSLVSDLAEVQEFLDQDGFLSAYPQALIDRNIAGKRVWAPWYTLHKLFAGLIDQYLYCDNKLALEVVSGMADWAYGKLMPLSEETRKTMLRNEFGGVNDSFYALYAITGNPDYRELATFFYHEEVLDPLAKKEDILNKKHANTYIPKLIGLSRGYELGADRKYREISEFFVNTVLDHHSFVTGSNSDREKFFEPDHQSEHLTGYTGESCNVYNMLKLSRHLFSFSADVKYADFYERALFNHIFGQQDPATGMIAYFLPMAPGAHKVYSTPERSFWCCVGTGFENQVKYGEAIYYHDRESLYVNLFIPSELDWKEKGVLIRQETAFPEEETIRLTIRSRDAVSMPLNVRYPSWAIAGAIVKVNGKKVKVQQRPGSYITLDRSWQDGDRVEVIFPMELKANPTPDNPAIVAFTYGPIVLAGRKGTEGMVPPAPYSDPTLYNDYYTYDYRIPESIDNTLELDLKKLHREIQPVGGTTRLRFRVSGSDVILEPLNTIHRERYVVYWNVR